ncbi:MAG TPA: serine hydroxymethyltransferase [Firmicutes bacterium]|nr:serine hydroxymethyltransferase [Candidatus Fermentithermobacillaceae bacterium]
MNLISILDPEIARLLDLEARRQNITLELIASENFVPPVILEAQGSILTNKYAEGYPGARYHGGCTYIDAIEQLAIDRAMSLFGAEHANVQPHSGVNANLAVYHAVLKPGDTILSMDLRHGGHLSHGSSASITGKIYKCAFYGVDPKTELIDYDQVRDLALKHKPKMIVAGASAYPRLIDYQKFREIADEVGAYLTVDMAHIAGLVAARVIPSPVPWADFVTSTTTKTLRGARGGFILCKKDYAAKVDKAIFPGTQGGPILQAVLAKAITFKLAGTEEFARYQRQVKQNAAVLSRYLAELGYRLVSGGTDNHLMLVDMRSKGVTGVEAEERLAKVNITVNKNLIPFDPAPPAVASGIRIGVAAVTTRGFVEEDMGLVAKLIDSALMKSDDPVVVADVREEVKELCIKHPLYFNFGETELLDSGGLR